MSNRTEHISTARINEAKTVMANVFKSTFDSAYTHLYQIAFETTNDHEIAKDIAHEAFSTLVETGIQLFNPDKIQKFLTTQTQKACNAYLEELNKKQEFHLTQFNNVDKIAIADDDNNEDAIIEAAVKAYHELPEDRKAMLRETVLQGSPARKVATKYKLKRKQLLNINTYSIQMLRDSLLKRI